MKLRAKALTGSPSQVLAEMDISDLCRGLDKMIAAAVTNVLSNSFAALVDIFLHYASPCKVAGVDDPEEVTLAISMKSMATIVRTCRLCSETCSFFEIQRASVRPALLLPAGDEDFSLGVYDADYGLPQFFEALVRNAAVTKYWLVALCDQVHPSCVMRAVVMAGPSWSQEPNCGGGT